MRSVEEIEERIARHKIDLAMWCEPDGTLVPTERDPDERELVRERLKSAIMVLEWVVG